MLCELGIFDSIIVNWLGMTVIAFFLIMGMSYAIFHKFYMNPTYESWKHKSNPKYPSAEAVRSEIMQMLKGMATATLAPAISLYLSQNNKSQGYCGTGGYSLGYHLFQFAVIWVGSDFFEFYYHRLGHTTRIGWNQHKHHHVFYNPSPFAVIADEYIDQLMRSLPLLVFPLIMPTNIDLLFFTYAVFFYAYGLYLHWGFEFDYPDAHHPYLNTSFQHYLHHARSGGSSPFHTGFFLKLWDQLFDSMYKGDCFCAKCQCAKGLRSREAYDKVIKPDYSPLLTMAFWRGKGYKDSKEVREKLQEFNREIRAATAS